MPLAKHAAKMRPKIWRKSQPRVREREGKPSRFYVIDDHIKIRINRTVVAKNSKQQHTHSAITEYLEKGEHDRDDTDRDV
jgi:hypothetical protein